MSVLVSLYSLFKCLAFTIFLQFSGFEALLTSWHNHWLADWLLVTHLVHPHLPEGQAHPLLHVGPLLVLLLQHVAGQEGGGRHSVVLLKRGLSVYYIVDISHYRDPFIPDNLINGESLFGIGFETSLDELFSILGHVGPLRFGKLILPCIQKFYCLWHSVVFSLDLIWFASSSRGILAGRD